MLSTFLYVAGLAIAALMGYSLGYTRNIARDESLPDTAVTANSAKTHQQLQVEPVKQMEANRVVTPAVVCAQTGGTGKYTDDQRRSQLSAAFRALKGRGELPQLLNDLGLFGEGVEVGVRNGEYSKWVLEHWSGSKMHMVDPWEKQDEKLYQDISNREQSHQDKLYTDLVDYMREKHPGRHELHRGYSVQEAIKFPDNSLDFVYLDARHDYDGVKEDLHAWWPKLKVGGVMAGHDFVEDGTNSAGLFGVQHAVWEFTRDKEKEFLSISTKAHNGGRAEPKQRVDGGWTTWYFIK
jgi:hypothetical protein